MSKEQRDGIPDPIKRRVRQRCGYGCVICGAPIYEYDHIIEWSIVKKHEAENITLLCPQHHSEKTKGLLTKEQVVRANSKPFALQEGNNPPLNLNFEGNKASLKVGSLTFINEDVGFGAQLVPILIDGIPLVNIKLVSSKYLISMILFDRYNFPILKAVDNELIFRNDLFDVEMKANRLIIREAAGKILIEMVFKPPNEIIFRRGHLFCNGVEILVTKEGFKVINTNNTFRGTGIFNGPIGLMIGHPQYERGIMAIPKVDRYKNISS